MASAFQRDNPVMGYGPRAHVKPGRREYLLWPAWMYRVVAPEVKGRQINVLEKAILGMCRAGTITADAIGPLLHIHRDLAALIVLQLQENDFLDGRWQLTTKARQVISEEMGENPGARMNLVTGCVFQDPWTEELWPRFMTSPNPVNREFGEDGYPRLLLGAVGKPKRLRPYLHIPADGTVPLPPRTPSPIEILAAAKRHQQDLRQPDPGTERDEESDTGYDQDDEVRISRVSFIDPVPRPVFLMTYLYLPEDDGTNSGWSVCDPFGLGKSPRLRTSVEKQFAQTPGLLKVVEELIGSALADSIGHRRQWEDQLRQQAIVAIDGYLTLDARNLPFYENLVEMESARTEADLLGRDCPDYKLRHVLSLARTVLEKLFQSVATDFPPGDAWRRVYAGDRPNSDGEFVRSRYETSASLLGLVPLPRSMAAVKPGHVRAVCKGSNHRLRAAVVTALLTARDTPMHPLRQAAEREPQLLSMIEEIAGLGGQAAHGEGQGFSPQGTRRAHEMLYRVVGLLTGLAVRTDKQVSESALEKA